MTEQQSTGLTWQESYAALEHGIARLVGDASATAAMVVRGDGQLLTWAGGLHEPSSLGALAAGSMAASEALLASVSDAGRPSVSLDGRDQSFFLQQIDQSVFLLVMFDQRCSLGLVRLRARRLIEEARPWLAGIQLQQSGLEELSDEEVDALFMACSPP